MRVCVFGDSFVAGVGDPKALGWVGRVAARTPPSTGVALTAYPLGVRGEATEDVVVRMPLECAARFARGDEHRLVISTGVGDAWRGIDPARSVAALEFGLGSIDVPTMIVGAPPVGTDDVLARLLDLDAGFADVCARHQVPYISTYTALADTPAWQRARTDDGIHPDQAGYGLLAYVVLHSGWYEWLGATPPDTPTTSRHRRNAAS